LRSAEGKNPEGKPENTDSKNYQESKIESTDGRIRVERRETISCPGYQISPRAD
jgi:hypothetical protein